MRVTSYADHPTAYGPLSDADGRRFVLRWRGEGVAEVAELVGGAEVKVADRGAAAKLTNVRLYVDRAQLPEPEDDEFYLADLIGLDVFDAEGARFGAVSAVHDYGAGASLEVERASGPPLLVPFTRASVPAVDIAAGTIVVNPPNEVEAVVERNSPPPLAGGSWGEGAAVLASPTRPNPLPQGEGENGAGKR